MILAGDVGGTKVHLAVFDFTEGKLNHTRDKQFPAKEYSGLEEIVKEFLGTDTVSAACFGVPGPVRDGRLRLTNLPWTLDSRELVEKPADRPCVSDQRPGSEWIWRGRTGAGPDLHDQRRRCEPDRQPRADRGGNRTGRRDPGVERADSRALSVRRRAYGFWPAQRSGDRTAALSAAEVQRTCQLRARRKRHGVDEYLRVPARRPGHGRAEVAGG